MKSFLESDGPEDFGGDGGGQHVNVLHVGFLGTIFFPTSKHPPAKQSGQLVPGEDFPAATEEERGQGKKV